MSDFAIWRIAYFGATNNPITLGYIQEKSEQGAMKFAAKCYGEIFTGNHGAVQVVVDEKAEMRELKRELKEAQILEVNCGNKWKTFDCARYAKQKIIRRENK